MQAEFASVTAHQPMTVVSLREYDSADRGVVQLVPSERGRALASRCRETQRQSAEALLGRLSDRQVATFLDVLKTLAASRGKTDAPGAVQLEGTG